MKLQILITLILIISNFADASVRCSQVHTSDTEVVVKQLAEMRLNLDLRIAFGEAGPVVNKLEREFSKKYFEAESLLGEAVLFEKIRSKIAELQGIKVQNERDGKEVRNNQNSQIDNIKISVVKPHGGSVHKLEISESKKYLVSASSDYFSKLFRINKNDLQVIGSIEHQNVVQDVRISLKENYVATASQDGSVKIYRIERDTLKEIKTIRFPVSVNAIEFSPNENYLAIAGNDSYARVYKIEADHLNPIGKFLHKSSVGDVKFSNDSKYMLMSSKEKTQVLGIDANGELRKLGVVHHSVEEYGYSVSKFTDDSQFIIMHSYRSIRVSHLGSDKIEQIAEVGTWYRQQAPVGYVSADGKTVIAKDNNFSLSIYRQENNNLNKIDELKFEDLLSSIAVTPDGNHVLISTADQFLRVYKIENNKIELVSEVSAAKQIVDFKFSEDGRYIAMMSQKNDNTMFLVYKIENERLEFVGEINFNNHPEGTSERFASIKFLKQDQDYQILISTDSGHISQIPMMFLDKGIPLNLFDYLPKGAEL